MRPVSIERRLRSAVLLGCFGLATHSFGCGPKETVIVNGSDPEKILAEQRKQAGTAGPGAPAGAKGEIDPDQQKALLIEQQGGLAPGPGGGANTPVAGNGAGGGGK